MSIAVITGISSNTGARLENDAGSIDYSSTGVKGIWQKINKEHNFVTFKHSVHYIEELLAAFNFYYVKELDFCAFKSLAENREVFFRIYISRKN